MPQQPATRPYRIAYVVTQAEFGGAQRYIADLAAALPRDAFAPTVIHGPDGEAADFHAALGSTPVRIATHLRRAINPGHDRHAVNELADLFRQIGADMVHLNSSKAGVVGAYAARRANVGRVVYTAHGFVVNEPMAPWRRLAYRLAERWSSRRKDVIICVSDFDRKTALAHRIADPVQLRVIHNGIHPATLNLLDRAAARSALAEFGVPLAGRLVGAIANFYPTKGLTYLIEAFAMVLAHCPDTHLVIIGDGQMRGLLTRLIRHHRLETTIHLPGRVPNAPRLLPAFDAYALTSIKEGFPYAILEAMAAGLPIVASRIGGVPEMIEHESSGLLVPAKHVLATAAALQRLLNDSVLGARLGAAARQRVMTQFTLERMVRETIACYSRQ